MVRVESHIDEPISITMSYALNVLAQGITELFRRDLMLQFQFS